MKYQNTKFLTYIKTDKSGTEIYHDFQCPRCGGVGYMDQFSHVEAGQCFECGGSGFRTKAHIVKVYTPEHKEKLEKIRISKLEDRVASEAERLAKLRIEQADEIIKVNKEMSVAMGFTANGVGYMYIGKTFNHRDIFVSSGAKFGRCGPDAFWVSPKDLGDLKGTKHALMNIKDLARTNALGYYVWGSLSEIGLNEAFLALINEYYKDVYEKTSKKK